MNTISAISSAALSELTKLGFFYQHGFSGNFTGATERQSGPEYQGFSPRNLDQDVKGTYLLTGKEDGPQSRRERKSGLKPRGSHKHSKTEPVTDTASHSGETWSSLSNESPEGEIA